MKKRLTASLQTSSLRREFEIDFAAAAAHFFLQGGVLAGVLRGADLDLFVDHDRLKAVVVRNLPAGLLLGDDFDAVRSGRDAAAAFDFVFAGDDGGSLKRAGGSLDGAKADVPGIGDLTVDRNRSVNDYRAVPPQPGSTPARAITRQK